MEITMEIVKGEQFFTGTIKKMPEVITQGRTINETKENILDALNEYLSCIQQQ